MTTLASTRIFNKGDARGIIDTSHLHLEWSEAPWDSALFGFPVLQITRMEVRDQSASNDMPSFETARDNLGAGLVSCRLSNECLLESMFLEAYEFRFIEMVYLPELDDLQGHILSGPNSLDVTLARDSDLPALQNIAGHAFRNERFHVDPRLNADLGDQRYRKWVENSFNHSSQRLYAIRDGEHLVAFFVTEMQEDGTCYWHLNAVAPSAQGRGYGRLAWLSMLRQAQAWGAKKVRTCIVARNHRVLNLYSRLGFRFPLPLMTFHWVREAQHD